MQIFQQSLYVRNSYPVVNIGSDNIRFFNNLGDRFKDKNLLIPSLSVKIFKRFLCVSRACRYKTDHDLLDGTGGQGNQA
jgi:hypothetical protein